MEVVSSIVLFPTAIFSLSKVLNQSFKYATVLFHIIFLNQNFNCEVIVDSRAVVRKNTQRSCVPFIWFLSMRTPCKTMVQCYNQDTDISGTHPPF